MEHNKPHNRDKGRRVWVAALVCGFVLSGCAGAKTDTSAISQSRTEITAQDVADFTTEGKPTRTVETPWGPKEIYDPVQDSLVTEAFKGIFDRNDEVILEELQDKMVVDADGNHKILETYHEIYGPDSEAELIFKALDARRRDYGRTRCRMLLESVCGSWITFSDTCDQKNSTDCYVMKTANPRRRCEVAGQVTYDRRFHPVGRKFFDQVNNGIAPSKHSLAGSDYKGQLDNYFIAHCNSWKT